MSPVTNGGKENDQSMIGGLLVFPKEAVLFDRMDSLGLGIGLAKAHMLDIGILRLQLHLSD